MENETKKKLEAAGFTFVDAKEKEGTVKVTVLPKPVSPVEDEKPDES